MTTKYCEYCENPDAYGLLPAEDVYFVTTKYCEYCENPDAYGLLPAEDVRFVPYGRPDMVVTMIRHKEKHGVSWMAGVGCRNSNPTPERPSTKHDYEL